MPKRHWHKPMPRTTQVVSTRLSKACRSAIVEFARVRSISRSDALEQLIWLGVNASGESDVHVAARLMGMATALLERETQQ